MKKIFAILLSFQLIISPMAFGQDIPGTEETKSGVTNDAYKKTGNGSSGGMDFYVSQIAGIGTGMLGASIITQCLEGLKTPSIATFMAGSLVHIASEILGAKKKNDRNKKKIDDLKLKQEDLAKSGDHSQLESLKAFLVEEEDTYEFLQNRKKWMIAVDVIYVAAVGLALAEEFYGLAAGITVATSTCTATATTTATSACGAAVVTAGGIAAATTIANAAPMTVKAKATFITAATPVATAAAVVPYGLAVAGGLVTPCIAAAVAAAVPICVADYKAKMEATKASTPSHSAARATMKTTCGIDTSCQAAAEAEMALAYAACLPAPADGGTSMFSWAGLLTMAYGFGSGQLNKDGGQVSQYGSMAISLLTAFVPTVSAVVSQTYNFPIPRSITFGVLAVMSGINTAGLAKREEIAFSNLVKLKNAITEFKIDAAGEGSGAVVGDINTAAGSSAAATKKKTELKKLIVNAKKMCISNAGGKNDISEKACAKPIKIGRPSFNKINIPALNNVSNMAADMAQALANGDESKAYGLAGDIGNMAARVKQATEELKAKYNEVQKKNNKPTLDFNRSIASQVASIQSSMNKAASSKGIDLASMKAKLDPEGAVKDDAVVATEIPGAPVVALPETDPLAGMEGAEELVAETPAEAVGASQSLDDFESSEQDVSKKSDVSIFKQLSNRYILNYTKMFDRKKPDVEVTQEEPKKN
jgi:hypothetical protein